MATFTSRQSGDWDDYLTWNASDLGYPGKTASGDIWTISTGHTVIFNIAMSSYTLAAGSIYGLLSFKTDMSTAMLVGNSTIIVYPGGELRIGNSDAPIDAAYKAELYINATSDASASITNGTGANTGKFTICGDVDYYGGNRTARLSSAWTSGQSFTVTGDRSAWDSNGGAKTCRIYMNKYSVVSGSTYLTHTGIFTINTAVYSAETGLTTITINEAAPGVTYAARAPVVFHSRNVIIGKTGASYAAGNVNSNRPQIAFNGAYNGALTFSYCIVIGIYVMRAAKSVFTDVVLTNSLYPLYTSYYCSGTLTCTSNSNAITGCIYCSFDGEFIGTISSGTILASCGNCTFNGWFWGGYYGFIYCSRCTFNADIFCCYIAAVHASGECILNGKIYFNTIAFANPLNGNKVSGISEIGWDDAGNSSPNSYDIQFSTQADGNMYLLSPKFPASGVLSKNQDNSAAMRACFYSENDNRTDGAMVAYHSVATMSRVTSPVRTGGAAYSWKVLPRSANTTTFGGVKIFEWTEFNVAAVEQIRSIYIYVYDWTTPPVAADLWFEAEYYDSASDYGTTVIKSTTDSTNNTWVEFPVTFTPGRVASVTYKAYFKTYEGAADYIAIDMQLNRNNMPAKKAVWINGEPVLMGDDAGVYPTYCGEITSLPISF